MTESTRFFGDGLGQEKGIKDFGPWIDPLELSLYTKQRLGGVPLAGLHPGASPKPCST